MIAPTGTPPAIVEKISADVRKLVNDPDFQKRIIDRGAIPDPRDAKEWTKFVNAEIVKWAGVIKRANIKVD